MRTFQAQDWVEILGCVKKSLCHSLYPLIHRNDTVMHKAMSVQRRLAITLWCLATAAEYRTISHHFGVARFSVYEIVQETCLAIVDSLLNVYIRFPAGEQLQHVINNFESKWGVP